MTSRSPSVLIIDDSIESIDVLVNALPKEYRKLVATSPRSALSILNKAAELPDVILMDIVMPEMDGFALCKKIKENKIFSEIPVIFLSSLDQISDKVRAFTEGGVDYIIKPFEIEEVRARVMTHIKLYRMQKELEHSNEHLEELVRTKVSELTASHLATIYSLARLAEARDHYTGEHLDRVQRYCELLARTLNRNSVYGAHIDDQYIENIKYASSLHDIGKVAIPDHILLKPGKLTEDEFRVMKTHTLVGANTLREVRRQYGQNAFIDMGIDIALSHHEKWNGNGYPNAVSGDSIPLSARIMSLVDVYDALRSQRSYKSVIPHEECCEVIREEKGISFDPAIVEAFLKVKEEFMQISILKGNRG